MQSELNKIKGYRVMAGITQAEMAEALGIQRNSYLQKEGGSRSFSVEELKKILSKLKENPELNNLTLDDLI